MLELDSQEVAQTARPYFLNPGPVFSSAAPHTQWKKSLFDDVRQTGDVRLRAIIRDQMLLHKSKKS
ncbi:MAG: hypothetical protein IPP88_21265 [Betaproteobacteria bacterium]|nr:hypothetical protein [Betaproteobacteria bacterium]